MINSLYIKNYKCFQDQNFMLEPFTILAGANGAGKSSLIQAILLLREVLEDGREELTITPQKIFGNGIGAVSQLISQEFKDKREIFLAANTDNGHISVRYMLDGNNRQWLKALVNERGFSSLAFPPIQYLTAERVGPRLYNGIGESEELLSPDGDNAAFIIDSADNMGLLVAEQLRYPGEITKFSYQVEKYLKAIMGEIELRYEADFDNAFIKTTIKTAAIDNPVSEPLTGFGYSYAFSIVVAGLMCSCRPGSILIVENPEAHLHPNAQSNIGKFLALISSCGVQVIVETHSEHIIDGARIQAAHQHLTKHMLIHFFSYGKQGTSVREIHVTEKGELSSWPKGFFDQKQTDLRELLEMKRL